MRVKIAQLLPDQLEKITELENEIGVILVGFQLEEEEVDE